MTERIKIDIDGHVADVCLNRPDKRNALDMEMFEALSYAGEQLASQKSVRAVVLSGAGEDFCAGIDVAMFSKDVEFSQALTTPLAPSPANLFQRAAYAWRELPVPVICALNGVVFGGGFQIAMGADIRYAAPDARLSIMEIKWGLIPDMALSTTLRHILPVDKIKELMFSGAIFSGEEAQQLGIVTAVHDDPRGAAHDAAKNIAAKSPDAIRAGKRLINQSWQLSEADSLALEAELQARIIGRANQLEAVRANFEKRAPQFED